MTERERRNKERHLENLFKMITFLIKTEREAGTSETEIFKQVDALLDNINQIRQELRENH